MCHVLVPEWHQSMRGWLSPSCSILHRDRNGWRWMKKQTDQIAEDGEGVHVHACVLAACSPYLNKRIAALGQRAMLAPESQKRTEFSRRVLNMPGFSRNTLYALVRYMYTSELVVSPSEVQDVLTAAKLLQIPELEVLKLESGRLVRSVSGRRLNRECFVEKTVKVNPVAVSRRSQQKPSVCDMSKDWPAGRLIAGLHNSKSVKEASPPGLVRDLENKTAKAEENRDIQSKLSTELSQDPQAKGTKSNKPKINRNLHRNAKVDNLILDPQGKPSIVRRTGAAQLIRERQAGVVEAVKILQCKAAGPSKTQDKAGKEGGNEHFRVATLEQGRATEPSQKGGESTSELSQNQQGRAASHEPKLKRDKPMVISNQEEHGEEAKQNKGNQSGAVLCRKAADDKVPVAVLSQGRPTMAKLGRNKEAEVNFSVLNKDNQGGALQQLEQKGGAAVNGQITYLQGDIEVSEAPIRQEDNSMASVTDVSQNNEGVDTASLFKNCGPAVTKQRMEKQGRPATVKLVLKNKIGTSLANRKRQQKGKGKLGKATPAAQTFPFTGKPNKVQQNDLNLEYWVSLYNNQECKAVMTLSESKEEDLATMPERKCNQIKGATVTSPKAGTEGKASVIEQSPGKKFITDPSDGEKGIPKVTTPGGIKNSKVSEQKQENGGRAADLLNPCKKELDYVNGLSQRKNDETTITEEREDLVDCIAETEQHGEAGAQHDQNEGAAEKSTKPLKEKPVAEIGGRKPRNMFTTQRRYKQGRVLDSVPSRASPGRTSTMGSTIDKTEREFEECIHTLKRESTERLDTQEKEEETSGREGAVGTCNLSQHSMENREKDVLEESWSINTDTCMNQQEILKKTKASRHLQVKVTDAIEERKGIVSQASRDMQTCSPKSDVHKYIPKKSTKLEESKCIRSKKLMTGTGASGAGRESRTKTDKHPHVNKPNTQRIEHDKAVKPVQDQVGTAGNGEMQGKTTGVNKGLDIKTTGEKRPRAAEVDVNENTCSTVLVANTYCASLNQQHNLQELQSPKPAKRARPSAIDFGTALEYADQHLVTSNRSRQTSNQTQSGINKSNVGFQSPKPHHSKAVHAETPKRVDLNGNGFKYMSESLISVNNEGLEEGRSKVDGENLPKDLENESNPCSDCGIVQASPCNSQDTITVMGKGTKAIRPTCPESVMMLPDVGKPKVVSKPISEPTLEPHNLYKNGNQENKSCCPVEAEEGVWVKEQRSRNIQFELFLAEEKKAEQWRSREKDEHLSELEDLLQQMLNNSSPSSPELDVGRPSPAGARSLGLLPDLSSGSDTDVDVLD
uniref:BTB domain-containing protein n=1 Tax=Leptobrachium leishanense TaxID=445787 RepID=A0A8C5PLC8_9ANUR